MPVGQPQDDLGALRAIRSPAAGAGQRLQVWPETKNRMPDKSSEDMRLWMRATRH
jgi:hypothetical protein